MRSHSKPMGESRAVKMSKQPASSGVTEGREMSYSVSWRVRDIDEGLCDDQSRNKSLMLVLERVCASTRLTMMAAYML